MRMSNGEAVEAAASIGHRIVKAAIAEGDGCTWEIVTVDLERAGRASKRMRATDSLYQGASGIALFLCELWAVTGDRVFLDCSLEAMRYCDRKRSLARHGGLHSGNIGVALVATRIWQVTGREEWREFALKMSAIDTADHRHLHSDIIGGAAGSILGLLYMSSALQAPDLEECSKSLGSQLVSMARHRVNGWSWDPGDGMARQDLTGYAHGSAGMAHAFLELFASTGENLWKFAAIRTLEYERGVETEAGGDWPDFRELDISAFGYRGQQLILRDQLRVGERRPTKEAPRSVRTWCHGAPGIAISRIRALHLGVDSVAVRSELERALRSTRESISEVSGMKSHSLCHGSFGNAETLLLARHRVEIEDEECVAVTVQNALQQHGEGKRPWGTGVMGGVYDPSLLVGEAGIGHFLLRVSNPDTPSVLCVSDWRPARQTAVSSMSRVRASELSLILPTAMAVLRTGDTFQPTRERIDALVSDCDSFATLIGAVTTAISADGSPHEELLRDAIRVDEAFIDAQEAFDDYVTQYCDELMQPLPTEISWEVVKVCLPASARVVQTEWSWSEWSSASVSPPIRDGGAVVVYRRKQSVIRKHLTPLQALIVSELVHPMTVSELERRVISLIEFDEAIMHEMPDYVREIVQDGVVAGFVRVSEPCQKSI